MRLLHSALLSSAKTMRLPMRRRQIRNWKRNLKAGLQLSQKKAFSTKPITVLHCRKKSSFFRNGARLHPIMQIWKLHRTILMNRKRRPRASPLQKWKYFKTPKSKQRIPGKKKTTLSPRLLKLSRIWRRCARLFPRAGRSIRPKKQLQIQMQILQGNLTPVQD